MSENDKAYGKEVGANRFLVKCQKCGHVWLARTPTPTRCALCNNPHPAEPLKYNK
jgi:rubrerythrin